MSRGSSQRRLRPLVHGLVALAVTGGLVAAAYQPSRAEDELPNRIPQAPPYVTAEAAAFPPPFESHWKEHHNPGTCSTCHSRIFKEWNGSMMSNSWRDPGWRGAFLLVARLTSTAGNCDTPNPPDGSKKSSLNPFANADCSASFDMGTGTHETAHSGSLFDGFCAQCHMPTNYVDNVPLAGVSTDPKTGREHGKLDPDFNPTSDNGTGLAFATLEGQLRNTETGKRGIFCAVCHTLVDTRQMPFTNHTKSGTPYPAATRAASRAAQLPLEAQDRPLPPAPGSPHLGHAIGAGSYQLSPHAIGFPEYLGPLAGNPPKAAADPYLSGVFGTHVPLQQAKFSTGHKGYYQNLHERAELCAACHDVTNPLTIRNVKGKWVGGFPIERTYTEWSSSRYADRPGNLNFDPRFKRDCQTCHMQQDFGHPGTAKALYQDGRPIPPLTGNPANDGPERTPYFAHHFIGGNSYSTRLVGADVDAFGTPEAYPQLSTYSYSSADPKSVYNNAYWTNVKAHGPVTQHARLAWDRLRNVLDLDVTAPAAAPAGRSVPLRVTVTNSGSGHKFPSGFPEGRVAWLAVRAFDLASGAELPIYDSFWKRTSRGVGYLTRDDGKDPRYPQCDEVLPAGSPDPYAVQFKAVASLGDGCPTLELPYATPLNLVVNRKGLPIDRQGRVIDAANPNPLPRFTDTNGNGDLFDDSYLADTRLQPLPHPGATASLDRYSVVLPPGVRGPVAVSATVYYQSFEAVVAKKFLGNLADTNTNFRLETCVLGGACDGRKPETEPAVVEGSPPVPMISRSWVIDVQGGAEAPPPSVHTYPAAGATGVYRDVVVKAFFSQPVQGVDAGRFTLTDQKGAPVPAFVDAIGDGTWGLFPHQVFLEAGKTYTARLAAGVCDFHGKSCSTSATVWKFQVAATDDQAHGDTSVQLGFPAWQKAAPQAPAVLAVGPADAGSVALAFSKPVMNVTPRTVRLTEMAGADCKAAGAPLAGSFTANATGDRWLWRPEKNLPAGRRYCVSVDSAVYDLEGRGLARPYVGGFRR